MTGLKQQLADVLAAQEKGAIGRRAMEDSVVAKESAEVQVGALTEELSEVKTTHAQDLLVCYYLADAPKVLLISTQKRADNAEYERDGTKARVQQLK